MKDSIANIIRGLLAAAVLIPVSSFAASDMGSTNDSVGAYEARYEVLRGGSNYGEAVRSLTFEDGRYKLYTETEISLLFLSDRRRYWSEFSVSAGDIQSTLFSYKRTGTGSNKGFSGEFNWSTNQLIDVASQQPIAVDIQTYSMDEAASIEKLRLDIESSAATEFSYHVVDEKGQAEDLRFRRVGEEILRLPYGEVTAIKVERVRENSRRETDYWFAPELEYVLVKMAQRKDGDEVATLQLRQLTQ